MKSNSDVVCDVLRSGWVSCGPQAAEFENKLAKYLGCKYVRAVNSGSSAILLALKAIGIGPGDSVIVPAFTCAATALPILILAAEPIFVDVQVSTFNMTWPDAEKAIRPDTKAIILVHLFGRMADAAKFAEHCRERSLSLIEDACLALGAKQNSKSAGTFGRAGCFSFHPRKIITTGEGGAVCTDDQNIAEAVECDRNYGAVKSAWERFRNNESSPKGFEHSAFNFKLTDLQAAVGIAQLNKISTFINKRKEIVARYTDGLAEVPGIQIPALPADAESFVPETFVCLWTPHPVEALLADKSLLHRAESDLRSLRAEISSQGIAISDAAQCLPELGVFSKGLKDNCLVQEEYPQAYLASRLCFALPIFAQMELSMVDRVISTLKAACKKRSV